MKSSDFLSMGAPMESNRNAALLFKVLQIVFYIVGVTILLALFFLPPVGVTLLWNILIPVAPALLVVGTGLWRNVCPLGTTTLFPDKFNLSLKIKVTNVQRNWLNFVALVLLFGIIPLRHIVFDTDGFATALLLFAAATIAVSTGFLFERKSGWCSGLCPVHQVEVLYGSAPAFTGPNLHCSTCVKCSTPCPDSTVDALANTPRSLGIARLNEYLLVGAFPGYVWGWFQVPDFSVGGWDHLALAYGYPVIGGLTTMAMFYAVRRIFKGEHRNTIISLFAMSAVACYYWYRLPMLFGFSPVDTNGVLVNLSNVLPAWTPILFNVVTTGFFFWWMILRKKPLRSWSHRPQSA